MNVSHDAPVDGPKGALLAVEDLVQEFRVRSYGAVRGGLLQAVAGVSFELREMETLGLVGETGSGKSTLARSVLQVPPPTAGKVVLDGVDLTAVGGREVGRLRRAMQMVFQDPIGSLDPQWTVTDIVREPLDVARLGNRRERSRRADEVLDLVGLDPRIHGARKARELSGGQCQRVAIARAIAVSPRLLICDEAVSSLDVIIQAQILNLFEALRAELGLSYLFVAHDLAVVRQISDRVMVMYLGRVCEIGPCESVYDEPRHPYTIALLSSVLIPDPDAKRPNTDAISGGLPSPLNPPSGCRFRTRCPKAATLCEQEVPELRQVAPDHFVACHYPALMPSERTDAP